MYKGFCISKSVIKELRESLFTDENWKNAYNNALCELTRKSEAITSRIAEILKGDKQGLIDGEDLQQACLPTRTSKYNLFISHSHQDEKDAKFLAIYLYLNYGLKCFVDGFIWWSSDEQILRPIDDRWSKHNTETNSYSYRKRNYSTSHVHAMLSMALLEMIDQCECCIFIKPNNGYCISNISEYTLSPWIYEEITMFNLVEKRITRTHRITESFSEPSLSIRYKLDLSNMPELKLAHLQKKFDVDYSKAYEWLDYLYNNVK